MFYTPILVFVLSFGITGWISDLMRKGADFIADFFSISPKESTQISGLVEKVINLGFDPIWNDFIDGKNAPYEAILQVCTYSLALMLLAPWAVSWVGGLVADSHQPFNPRNIKSLATVLVIVFVLKSGLLADGVYFLRIVTNSTYAAVMKATGDGLSLQEEIAGMNLRQEAEQQFYSKAADCQKLPVENNQRQECINEAKESTKKQLEKDGGKGIDWDLLFKGVQAAGTVASFPFQGIFIVISQTIEIGFLCLIEVAFLISAYISPIFVVFSILPGESKLFEAWFSSWFSLSLLKISYALSIGLIAQVFASTPLPTPILMPIFNGLLAPLLAVIIAAGGGMAFFSVSTEIISGVVRLVVTTLTGKISP